MTDFRADPDELLKALKSETSDKTRGRLKIFFGYAAGVGKTYSMLKSARAAKRNGVDVEHEALHIPQRHLHHFF